MGWNTSPMRASMRARRSATVSTWGSGSGAGVETAGGAGSGGGGGGGFLLQPTMKATPRAATRARCLWFMGFLLVGSGWLVPGTGVETKLPIYDGQNTTE